LFRQDLVVSAKPPFGGPIMCSAISPAIPIAYQSVVYHCSSFLLAGPLTPCAELTSPESVRRLE
jgi:hypothetical protein